MENKNFELNFVDKGENKQEDTTSNIDKKHPLIKKERNALAKDIVTKRQERDRIRKKAKEPKSKIKGLFGLKGGSRDLNLEADELQTASQDMLKSGKLKLTGIEKSIKEEQLKKKQEEEREKFNIALGEFVKKVKNFLYFATCIPEKEISPLEAETLTSEIKSSKEFLKSVLSNEKTLELAKGIVAENLLKMFKGGYYRKQEHLERAQIEIRNFALDVIYENIEHLGESLEKNEVSCEVSELLSEILNDIGSIESKYPDFENKIKEIANNDKFFNQLKEDLLEKDEPMGSVSEKTILLLKTGDELKQKAVLEAINEGWKVADFEENKFENVFTAMAEKMCKDRSEKLRQLGEEFVKSKIEEVGLDPDKTYAIWEHDNYNINENLHRLKVLEKKDKDLPVFLTQKCGIYCFQRYTPEILIKQKENWDNRDVPYGVAVFAYNDHNGAFSGTKYLLANLERSLRELEGQGLDGSPFIRIFECGSELDLAKKLVKANQRFNPDNREEKKIAFLIIGGHGTPVSIAFGDSNTIGDLKLEHLKHERAEKLITKVKNTLQKDSSVILNSCSTGKEQGIGQELSSKLETYVSGPNIPGAISKIDVELKNGKLKLTPTYSVEGRHYFQGEVKTT